MCRAPSLEEKVITHDNAHGGLPSAGRKRQGWRGDSAPQTHSCEGGDTTAAPAEPARRDMRQACLEVPALKLWGQTGLQHRRREAPLVGTHQGGGVLEGPGDGHVGRGTGLSAATQRAGGWDWKGSDNRELRQPEHSRVQILAQSPTNAAAIGYRSSQPLREQPPAILSFLSPHSRPGPEQTHRGTTQQQGPLSSRAPTAFLENDHFSQCPQLALSVP